jgi:hypothetical protein
MVDTRASGTGAAVDHNAFLAQGEGVMVDHHCKWILEASNPDTRVAFELHLDGDLRRDLVTVADAGGPDALTIKVDRTQLGQQTFTVPFPGADLLTGAAMGNFDGRGQALAFAADGEISTAAFNGGPRPAIAGAPQAAYAILAAARVNGDTFHDLVAARVDGELDVFTGSSSGLQFAESLEVVALSLDRDGLTDYVWIDDASGVHTASTLGGPTFRDVDTNPNDTNTIDLEVVRAGRFRRLAGSVNSGIEDVVTLGEDNAGGGVLIWCESTGGGGVSCIEAIDARFATGRDPDGFGVGDLNGDGLDDLQVSYTNNPTRIFLAGPNGFAPRNTPSRSFRTGVRLDATGVGDAPGFIAFNDEDGLIQISFFDVEGNEIGPVPTPIAFQEPFLIAPGNFNGDVAAFTGLPAEGYSAALPPGFPMEDVVISSGGFVFALISNGDGTFAINELGEDADIVSIQASDVTGDGVDDLETILADGSVNVFEGGAGGLDPVADNMTGLPSADGEDGKMLVVSGLGVDTVGATEARLRITVGEDDIDSHDQLVVQVFDGNNGGLHQFEEQTHTLKTCYRLNADPCGDGNIGTCSGGPTTPVELVTVSSDDLGDDVWDTIFEGPHPVSASLLRDGEAPFSYELRVYLSEDCAILPAVGSTIPVATADAFKVRANAMVSHPVGEFSFVGSDTDGDFGVPNQSYMRDTAFDGVFELPIAVGSSATEVQLMEADADDTDDSTPGVSLGATADIQYRLVRPNGTDAPVVGAEDSSPTAIVTNPSGNNDGFSDLDVETRIHTITTPTPGTWIWRWEGVTASNAVHVFAPFGSPTTFEVLGARRRRSSLTTVQQPSFWDSNAAALQARLPITLGASSGGTELGATTTIRTLADARQVIANADQSLTGELRRQLLIARLNQGRGAELGEDLRGGLVYGTTTTVRTVLERADRAVTGVDLELGDDEARRLVQLLSAVNLGEINYRLPGVPFPARPMLDDDDDGVMNLKDNCPPVANPLQEDGDDDRIGDACAVVPVVQCVRRTSETSYRAHFGYDNPLSYRSIALGSRNWVHDGSNGSSRPLADFGQPSEFAQGLRASAWLHDFSNEGSVEWRLDDQTARATADGPACSGRELTVVPFVGKVAVFGTESVVIGEHSAVIGKEALATAFSEGDVVIGADTVVDNVMSGGRTTLGERSFVVGSAVTRLGVERRPGAAVSGRAVTSQGLPSHSLAWLVDFRSGADVGVSPEEIRRLAPGEYGNVTVGPSAQLVLERGWYRFASLDVDDSATVVVSDEVVLHVNESFAHHGETRLLGNEASIVVAFFGTSPAVIDSSFQGVVVASNASLTLGSAYNSLYRGAFFARSVEILPGTLVEFAPR